MMVHYSDINPQDFLTAVVNKIQATEPSTIYTPSDIYGHGPSVLKATKVEAEPEPEKPAKKGFKAAVNMAYPVQLLTQLRKEENYSPYTKVATPSPTLGPSSPRVRCTPLGIPEGGACGAGARLVTTAPQPMKPWTTMSLHSPLSGHGGRTTMSMDNIRSHLRTSYTRKPLDERVKAFCKELDDIRVTRSQIGPLSVNGT